MAPDVERFAGGDPITEAVPLRSLVARAVLGIPLVSQAVGKVLAPELLQRVKGAKA